MNIKLITILGVVLLVVFGWMLIKDNTVSYTAAIDDEVAQLEMELAELEAMHASGALSAEAAAEAQRKIVSRLSAIDEAVTSSERASLTPSQRVQLLNGLDRLKSILINYRDTLNVIDEAVLALPESERPRLNPQGRTSPRGTIVEVIRDVIDTVENHTEEVIEDYVLEEDNMTDETDNIDETATTTNNATTTSSEEGTDSGSETEEGATTTPDAEMNEEETTN